MNELLVSSFEEFHRVVKANWAYGALFRGVPDSTFALVPRVGRSLETYQHCGETKDRLLHDERLAFRQFCEDGASLLPQIAGTQLERLVVAQHHGLPTRLLDWTMNPLVGLFFACSAKLETPGAVFVLKNTKTALNELTPTAWDAPFDTQGVQLYFPKHVAARVTGQRGVFTIHGDPTEPFVSANLTKILVAAAAKNDLLKTLKWYGVTDFSLFPDLDGLSRFIASTALLNFGPR